MQLALILSSFRISDDAIFKGGHGVKLLLGEKLWEYESKRVPLMREETLEGLMRGWITSYIAN